MDTLNYKQQKSIILKVAIYSRLFLWVFSILSSQLVDNFDSSTGLKSVSPLSTYKSESQYLLDHSNESNLINIFIKRIFLKWDSFYFTRIAEFGYEYEQNHAFFPFFPFLMNLFANGIRIIFPKLLFSDCIVVSGFLISNICFILSAFKLLKLGNIIFKNSKFALISTVLYCINPAGIFTIAIYTESLFGFLVFSGLVELFGNDYYLNSGKTMEFHHLPLGKRLICGFKASFYFALATLTRSNGILSIGYIIYHYYNQYFTSFFRFILQFFNQILFRSKTTNTLKKPDLSPSSSYDKLPTSKFIPTGINSYFDELIILPIIILLQMAIVLSPYIGFQYYGYTRFCDTTDYNIPMPVKNGFWPRSWCTGSGFPNLYDFVQKAYWNQGFFNYYTVQQIPNFLLAGPMIFISISAVVTYISYFISHPNQMIFQSFRQRSKNNLSSISSESTVQNQPSLIYFSPHLMPFIVYLAFLVIFGVTFMHVQVITRFFIHSPVIFWFCAKYFITNQNGGDYRGTGQRSKPWKKYFILFYFIFYNILGSIMFTNFYPWT